MSEVDQEQRQAQAELDPVERKIPFFLRIELYLPLILIGGISLAVLLYARGMYGAGWSLERPPEASVVSAFVETSPTVVFYTSPTTRDFLGKVSGSHEVLLKHWREYFKEHKREFREVSDPAGIASAGNAVIVVPSALALSDAERRALTEHHKRGGGILATGAFGARDGAGNWVGWGLMQDLFGARVLDEVEIGSEKNFLVTAAETPITAGFVSGSRFWVGKSPENRLRFEGGKVAARFLDWARTHDGKGASVVFGEKGGGRWVLFGFSENAWDGAPTPMRTLADGAIDWLQRRPKAVLASWPAGYRAAHVVSMNVDESLDNVAAFASSLDVLKIRGTFFVVADAAANAPAALKSITSSHEIAYHGDGYAGFKAQPKVDQQRRVVLMQQKIGAALRPQNLITGFRAPTESYDARTEEVLQAAGLRYHAVDPNRTDARLPLFAKANRMPPVSDVVVLPRTQRDDIVYLQNPEAQLNEIIGAMKGELGLVVEQGALGMLSVHSRNFAKDGVMAQAVPAYLLTLAEMRDRVWLATASEVADWWRKRYDLRVSLNVIGKRQELEISNVGEATIEGATAIVYHPRVSNVTISPTKAWMPEATVKRIDEFSSRVVFGSMGKGDYAYKLVFE
jgi:hypothetical protein